MTLRKLLFLLTGLCFAGLSAQITTEAEDYAELDSTFFAKYFASEETRIDTFPPCYRFRVQLRDKEGSSFSLKEPSAFLSEKAIARRAKYGINVDWYDLPVSPVYLDILRRNGAKIYNTSRWYNTVTIESADSTIAERIKNLPFVSGTVILTWIQPRLVKIRIPSEDERTPKNKFDAYKDFYGGAQRQVSMLSIPEFHKMGFDGKGVTIAMIDGGFKNADRVKGIKQENILSTRNFVRPDSSVYVEGAHGLNALSCIAAYEPYALIGTAPNAQFHLLVSEDSQSEQLVEEDNWVSAIEYADSIGVDIVSSSLGYTMFDHKFMNHTYREQDGQTSLASRAASLAASRGLIVCVSAGNDGEGQWKRLGFPADAKDVLAVGALTADSVNATFSSLGNTADGRIKPDVTAMGEDVRLIDSNGTIIETSGTSFSCPLVAGAVACLLQAHPDKTPLQIMEAIRLTAHNARTPDNVYGFGLPNIVKAHEYLQKTLKEEVSVRRMKSKKRH